MSWYGVDDWRAQDKVELEFASVVPFRIYGSEYEFEKAWGDEGSSEDDEDELTADACRE